MSDKSGDTSLRWLSEETDDSSDAIRREKAIAQNS
jgi:hypothetical protein